MIVAAAQFTSRPLDITANAAAVTELVRAAGRAGAELVVFPELALSGYELGVADDPDRFALTSDDERLTVIRETCRDVRAAALVGGPGRTPQGTTISAFVYGPDGEPLTRYDKRHVTATERAAGFVPGTVDGRFRLGDTAFGIAICYDAHFPELAERAAAEGCHALLASSLYGSGPGQRERAAIMPALAERNGLYVVLANHLGPAGAYDACGGSAIWAPDGTRVAECAGISPGFVTAEL
ncbi:carbon-nitrogen hydrolase family protein [Nocardia otitidiscaviarum]|uniref:carbon-nitrogen hydrolase family protein n=1 Tax=Nocardia otitidiscaviarum TaxID=1823 RepID=UPI001895E094|nr:carbon-nitrogen hydrolase family protein [Nocardia otitidiscaviarum]MBF6135388.1 carbon-nitrogen hydrolase family protein [Nocardia otitidiscaviarum]